MGLFDKCKKAKSVEKERKIRQKHFDGDTSHGYERVWSPEKGLHWVLKKK